MITLVGHGYVGKSIAEELFRQNQSYNWISHNDKIPSKTNFIINSAGYTGTPNVDSCEVNRQECIEGNVIWPLYLERENPKIQILHISSGCIYQGYPQGGYTELDKPNFTFNNGSFYSGCKALAQDLLMPYMNKSYLFRIRMPFGKVRHSKNFLTKLENYEKIISFENSLSFIEDVAKVSVYFALNKPDPGIYNICNPGSSNAKEICKMMNLNKKWLTTEEFNKCIIAPRSNCILSTEKIQKVFKIRNIHTALEEAILEYK